MLEKLKQANQELAELKAKHLEKSKEVFIEVTKTLFEKHPTLKSFSWTQYTPYFNDGEECTFGVNKDCYINGLDPYNDIFDEHTTIVRGIWDKDKREYVGEVTGPNPKFDKELNDASVDVHTLMEEMNDEVLRDMFGDHVEVTVTKEGVDTQEYEHD